MNSPLGAKVALVRAREYSQADDAVRQALDLLGGMRNFLKPGSSVLLKPNLLCGAPPDKNVTSHPAVVEAVVKLAREAGCEPMMGDSPSIGSGNFHAVKAGYTDLCRRMKVPWVSFEDSITVEGGSVFKRLEVARILTQVDAVINLAKLKTHGQTYLTLAVKNMFGIVPGVRKAQWHMQAGSDLDFFCRMLVEMCYRFKPVLNIIDGITAMQGNGPRNGKPFPLGCLIAGSDPSATDRVICDLLKVNPNKVRTIAAAEFLGCGITDLERIEVVGDEIGGFNVRGFEFSGQELPMNMGSFAPLVPLARKALTSRPAIDLKMCTVCAQCVEQCPAEAMKISPNGRMKSDMVGINLKQCIRCYCCSEICPEGAIAVKQGWGWKFIPQFLRR